METAPGGCDVARIKLHYGSIEEGLLTSVRVTRPTYPHQPGGQRIEVWWYVPTEKRGNPSPGISPVSYRHVIIASCGLTA